MLLLANAFGIKSFESEILPILQAKCSKCHGKEKQNSELRLDTVEGIIKGGGSGEPLMVKGDAESSLIISFIKSDDADEKMPPEESSYKWQVRGSPKNRLFLKKVMKRKVNNLA